MPTTKRELLEPPNPANFHKKSARQLAGSIYHYAQLYLNGVRIDLGIELVPDRFRIPHELIDAMVAHSDIFIRDFWRVIQSQSNHDFLSADELYRDWYKRVRAKNLKEYRKQLAQFAASQKSLQASERKRKAIEIANQKAARRPSRSKRAIAMDIASEIDRSDETIRKYLSARRRAK